MPVKAIPEGYHTATPYLVVRNAAEAIEYYKKAFGAQEVMRMPTPDGKIGHAELKIGDSMVMLADENDRGTSKAPQTLGGTTAGIMLYVEDADATFHRAINAGGKVFMPLTDMFWGDRFGQLTDPFGQAWSVATHKEDVSPAEMEKRMKQFAAQMSQQAQKKSA
ncbi:MAG TPA: VOC family protein [Terriglobales bacterium]|nr:VOC family protein [Terriglobales bacterium]